MEPPGGSTDRVVPHRLNTSHVNPEAALRWSKRRSVQGHLRLMARLARMGPRELGQRVARSLSKRLGFAPTKTNAPLDSIFAHTSQSNVASIQEYLSKQLNRSFYFGPANRIEIVAKIRNAIPDADEKVCKLAHAIGSDGLHYLGQKVRIVAGEIDWQADPISGKRCWTAGVLDEAEAIGVESADVKYVWEVNRQQFLPILGRAYWFTGDIRHAQQAIALIDDWITKNPVGLGVNWCSHLEVAMRAISWMWTMPYLLTLPGLSEAFLNRWIDSIESHFHHLRRNLSIFTDPTNHLIGEATALWMLCVCFPNLPDADQEKQKALLILTREVERQIGADGVNREQATSYHRFVLDFYLQILILAKRNEFALAPAIAKQVKSMIEFVAAMAGSNGVVPMIGDSDDARGIPFLELVGWDFEDTLSTGAVLFQRREWKRSARPLAEISVWILGVDAVDEYNTLSYEDDQKGRAVFPEGGYCFSESSDPSGHAQLIFDVGPLGLWPNAAHGHADALSILIRLNGKLLLTDPGTGAYFGAKNERDYFRSTAAHNTVTIDDWDQADLYDTFKWVNPMTVKLVDSHTLNGFSYFVGTHDGYRRLRAGLIHQRAVFSTETKGWIIVDQFDGRGRHSIKRHFNFHPGTELEQIGHQAVLAWDPIANNGLRFDFPLPENSPPSYIDIAQTGQWSGRYGDIQIVPHMAVETVGIPTVTLFAFITPIFSDRESQRTNDKSEMGIRKIDAHDSYVCQRRSPRPGTAIDEFVLVNPSRRNATMPSGHSCNARFAYVQQTAEGIVRRALLIGEGASLIGPNFQLSCPKHENSASFSKVIQ